MNSKPRQPAVSPAAYRQDDERRRDEARLVAMQNQIDELRQAMREMFNRQGREEELLKHFESTVAQNRLAIEQLRQEMTTSGQARALDENRTRQQIVDFDTRLEDAGRPIRSLQAHVMELLEAQRRKDDDTGQRKQRDEEVQAQIEHLAALIDRTAGLLHQMRDGIDTVRAEGDQTRRDVLRAEDLIKIADQEMRRRINEVAQTTENFNARIDELRSDIGHLFDLVDDTRRSIAHVDPALEELRGADVTLRGDIARFQSQAIERHELLIDRIEDMRIEIDGRIAELRGGLDGRFDRIAERLEQASEVTRELGYRIGSLVTQLDELRLTDSTLRRDIWILHEQRVRLRMEQVQQELDLVTSQRRDAESEPPPAVRPRRQADH